MALQEASEILQLRILCAFCVDCLRFMFCVFQTADIETTYLFT